MIFKGEEGGGVNLDLERFRDQWVFKKIIRRIFYIKPFNIFLKNKKYDLRPV